jgi:hypothetical protein
MVRWEEGSRLGVKREARLTGWRRNRAKMLAEAANSGE